MEKNIKKAEVNNVGKLYQALEAELDKIETREEASSHIEDYEYGWADDEVKALVFRLRAILDRYEEFIDFETKEVNWVEI